MRQNRTAMKIAQQKPNFKGENRKLTLFNKKILYYLESDVKEVSYYFLGDCLFVQQLKA